MRLRVLAGPVTPRPPCPHGQQKSRCGDCRRAWDNAYRERRRDTINERQRAKRADEKARRPPKARVCKRGLHDLTDPAARRPQGGCRACNVEQRAAYRATNADAIRARKAAAHAANPEAARERARAWYTANPERAAAASKAHREANPEAYTVRQRAYRQAHRTHLADQKRADHAANRDRDLERSRAWYEANRDHAGQLARAWQVRNPGKVARIQHRRRAKKAMAVSVPYTAADVARLMDRYGGLCGYCRSGRATEVDHMIPIAMGGPDALPNLLPVCRRCNASKGHKTVAAWLRRAHAPAG